jgi:hypothetical protein
MNNPNDFSFYKEDDNRDIKLEKQIIANIKKLNKCQSYCRDKINKLNPFNEVDNTNQLFDLNGNVVSNKDKNELFFLSENELYYINTHPKFRDKLDNYNE